MIALLAFHAALTADSLMGPGVSHELARYRAERVADVRYELGLDVTRRDTLLGNVRVHFNRKRDGDVILDFRGHWLRGVVVNGKPTANVEFNGAHLRIPARELSEGANTLYMRFASPIAPAGASVIRFTDDRDKRDYLYTLLVPSDANLLFPCFDQPDLKAVFSLQLSAPDGWRVLTNASDKPMSTYLFAFAAGPYEVLKSADSSRSLGMTLWVRESRAREVETDSIIGQNRRAKNWLADWFGIPYPFEKMDMLLAPAFPFGGMEHPGAIFYNEESFIYREPPTLVQRLGRQATINHEVAHQWFGDFTTMRWFDDLWMKEGFATYMAAKMQAAMGDSTAWMSFYLRNKPAAYDVDVTAGTTPVWQELKNLDQAKSNYGAIVYNKAPGVLKQLEFLVGEKAFRAGVSSFLKAHAYGNANWRELLASVGAASGRDLTSWGEQYFVRPGMPIVEQQLQLTTGTTNTTDTTNTTTATATTNTTATIGELRLIQRPAQPSLSGKGVWPMKVQVLLQYADRAVTLPVEMRAETTVVAAARGLPAPLFVYPNVNDHGYGLFMLDNQSVDWLLRTHVAVQDPFLRAMLWGSLWDLVRDARLRPSWYVGAAVVALATEKDEQIASRLLGRVARAMTAYVVSPGTGTDSVEAALLRGATDMSKSYGLRKMFFDTYVSVASTPGALARLDAWLDSARAVGEPLRQPSRWSIVQQLAARNYQVAGGRLQVETARDTSTAAKRRAFIAGAAFPRAEVKKSYFERYFRDSTLNEDWVTSSLGAFNDGDQSALTLQYLRPALDTLAWVQKNRRIFFLGRWLDAFVSGHRSPEALAVVDAFLAEHPELPKDLRQKVLQVRDDLERTVRIRARSW